MQKIMITAECSSEEPTDELELTEALMPLGLNNIDVKVEED